MYSCTPDKFKAGECLENKLPEYKVFYEVIYADFTFYKLKILPQSDILIFKEHVLLRKRVAEKTLQNIKCSDIQ